MMSRAFCLDRRSVPGLCRFLLVLACVGLWEPSRVVWAQATPSGSGSMTAAPSAVDLWAPLRKEQAQPRAPRRQGLSWVVYPQQRVPLHFSHRRHLARGTECVVCHSAAVTSTSSRDNLLPREEQCQTCHAIDRSRPFGALFSTPNPGTPPSACATCHVGFPSEPAHNGQPTLPAGSDPATRILRVDLPPPNLKFNHRLHGAQGIGCSTCHGDLSGVDEATRVQLPSMDLCLRCHAGGLQRTSSSIASESSPAPGVEGGSRSRRAGSASDRCSVCHPTESSGLLQLQFASGVLVPTGALRGDDHREADFRTRHGSIAQSGVDYCSACHRESYCMRCHNAVTKPLDLHGGNYVARHAIDARRNQPDCSTCHRQQSFCIGCHERLAVASHSTLPGRPPVSAFAPAQPRRFHPEGWASVGGGAPENQHGIEARRNQRSCASCHREDTCLACHSTLPDSRVPGGANPHPIDWISSGRCRALVSHNPRLCLKCHREGSAVFSCP